MEMEELTKILMAVVVLIILVGMVTFLLLGKGTSLLDSIKNLMRFGGN